MSRTVTILSVAVLVSVPACSRSGTACDEYVEILTEESVRFGELVEPNPSRLDPVSIALAQSDTPGDRMLADIDRMVVNYDILITDFDTAAQRLAEATAAVQGHDLSGYGSDLAAVFGVLTDIYAQSRDQLQRAVETNPERVLRGEYFIREGGDFLRSVRTEVLSADPLESFVEFTTYLVDNCPTLEAMLGDAWQVTQPDRTAYRHWDTTALGSVPSTTTRIP